MDKLKLFLGNREIKTWMGLFGWTKIPIHSRELAGIFVQIFRLYPGLPNQAEQKEPAESSGKKKY